MKAIKTNEEFTHLTNSNIKSILFFWAPWNEPSKLGGQMHQVFETLSQKFSTIQFFTIEAEAFPEISESLQISVVPTFVFIEGKTVLKRLEGANPPELTKLVKEMVTGEDQSQSTKVSNTF